MSRALQIVLSIFGWWVLVVLPGVLTLAGAFGELTADTEIGGAVVGVWVAGFVAQLAMLYVVAKAVGHTRQWWFLVGSLLPWVVDWSTPVGIGWGLLWIGIAGLVAAAMIFLALRNLNLDLYGTVVTGTVVKVLRNHMNVVINNVYIRRRVLFEIPGPNGSYQATLAMLCEIGTAPEKGDTFQLRVDPKNPKHFEIDPSHFHHDD